MSKNNDKYEDPLDKQNRLIQEEQGFKAMFKHDVMGPIAMGAVVGIGGVLTPYAGQAGLIGVGMATIGFYNMLKDK
jgi:hypothetical protein